MSIPTFNQYDDAPSFWVLGDLGRILLSGESTDGRFTLAETITVPGGGPPPHLHRNEDEVFYILDGNFEFLVGEKSMPAPPGTLLFAPRNIIHQFRNKGPGNGTFVCWAQPARFEKFITELGTSTADSVNPPPMTPQVVEKLNRLCQEYGIEIHDNAPESGTAPVPPQPQTRWVLGVQVKVLCTGADSNGSLCVAEVIAPTGGAPPRHLHVATDEVFHILDGKFEFIVGDRKLVAERGDTVFAPRQTPHLFTAVGDATSRLLDFHTPSGMEHFFAECAEPTREVKLTPQQILALCEKHGMKVSSL